MQENNKGYIVVSENVGNTVNKGSKYIISHGYVREYNDQNKRTVDKIAKESTAKMVATKHQKSNDYFLQNKSTEFADINRCKYYVEYVG